MSDEEVDQRELETPQISLHAMARILMPQTLKFTGCIGKSEVQILVDGGSTHNFLQSKVVSMLKFPVTCDRKFEIMVGNREKLTCADICSAIPIQIQKQIFLVDFYVLPILGAEVVLGVQWLQLLGPILMDYQKLTM